MAEEKQKSAETAQALSEEQLGKVVGALGGEGWGPGESGKEILSVKFFKMAKEKMEEMFHPASEGFNKGVESLKRGLRGEGIQSRENKENLRNVLKGKAKW